MTLATKITLLRIILIPLFIFLLGQKLYFWASVIFILLALTDILDGLLARVGNQKTELGSVLDPLADKLLLSSAYLVLALQDKLPLWLFLIVFTRDLLIVVGWTTIYILTKNTVTIPRIAGKISTIMQVMTVLLILLNLPWKDYFFYLTAALTIISGIDYLLLGSRKLVYAK